MSKLDELKDEVARLEAEADQAAKAPAVEEWQRIADGDPDLIALMTPKSSTIEGYADYWNANYLPKTLEEGKKQLAKERRQARLLGVVRNESLPLQERIKTGNEWKAGLQERDYYKQFSGEVLVETLCPHPHSDRLCELAAISQDASVSVKRRFWALDEYRRLLAEFPHREHPKEGLWLLDHGYDDYYGRNLAHKVGQRVAAMTGKSSSYIASLCRNNRGRDYDMPLSEVCAPNPQPEPERELELKPQPRRALTSEDINKYFDAKIAELYRP